MHYEPNDDYRRALDVLTIQQIWQAAHLDGAVRVPPPTRAGLCGSPFRDDGARPSFSVLGDGRGFKDHGGDGSKGGLKKFAELCWPGSTAGEIATRLIDLSGIVRTPPPRAGQGQEGSSAGAVPAGGAVDPTIARAAKAIEKRDRMAAMENKIYEDREKRLRPPAPHWAVQMPDFVAARWTEGVEYLRREPARLAEIATERGWPVSWAEALIDADLVSMPWERAATPGAKWHKRQKAFLVQQPSILGADVTLKPVGYHQRFFDPGRDGRPPTKGWLYLPSMPKFAPRSDYERSLTEWCATQGCTPDNRKPLVPPAPFVLGDLTGARLVVLLEGQWDAITFYGACGWLHDTTPAKGVVVFGIRGAQGMDAFLGLWHRWLERRAPRVWLLADNDAAGGTWRDAPAAEPGLPQPPSIGERLVAAGCVKPVVSWLERGPWGKDFNDYFRFCGGAAKLTPAIMYRWMAGLGLLDTLGGRSR